MNIPLSVDVINRRVIPGAAGLIDATSNDGFAAGEVCESTVAAMKSRIEALVIFAIFSVDASPIEERCRKS